MIGMGAGGGSRGQPVSEFCLEGCRENTSQSAGVEPEGLILLPGFFQTHVFPEPRRISIIFLALIDFLPSLLLNICPILP